SSIAWPDGDLPAARFLNNGLGRLPCWWTRATGCASCSKPTPESGPCLTRDHLQPLPLTHWKRPELEAALDPRGGDGLRLGLHQSHTVPRIFRQPLLDQRLFPAQSSLRGWSQPDRIRRRVQAHGPGRSSSGLEADGG